MNIYLINKHFSSKSERMLKTLFLILFSIVAQSQTPVPFGDCPTDMYLTQVGGFPAAPTRLYDLKIVALTGSLDYNQLGASSSGNRKLNAIGFNPVDKFIYGINSTNKNVLRVGQNNVMELVGSVTNLPEANNFNTGEIDNFGNYYVKTYTNSPDLWKINLTNLTCSKIVLSASVETDDFAYSISDKCLYGVDNHQPGARLYKINLDPTSPNYKVVTFIGPTLISPSIFGAMYPNGTTGAIYGNENSGNFYSFDIATGKATFVGSSLGSEGNDGAHCVNAPIVFPVDLSITKTDNNASYVAGTTVEYTIVVKNNGPFTAIDAVIVDNLPIGIPLANMSYSKIYSGGGATLTPASAINNVETLLKDAFITYTVYIDVPSNYTGNLVNKATVTASENNTDTNLSNNSATDTDTQCLPPTITSQPAAARSVCLNAVVTPLSVTATGTASLTYQWYSNATNSTTGGAAINLATSATYTPPSTTTGTIYYYVIVKGVCPNSNTVTSNTSAVTVSNTASISVQPISTQNVCVNAASTALSVTAIGSTVTYKWYSNATNNNTSGDVISGATAATYTPSTATVGTTYYYVTVVGTCNTVTSSTSAVIVTALTVVTAQPATTQSVCQNSTPTALSVTASGTGTLTYQWYSNATNNTTSGDVISGATAATYTPSTATVGSTYYYVTVVGTCNTVTSSTSAVVVNALTQIPNAPSSIIIVQQNDAMEALSVYATGKNLTYQWYSNTVYANSGGTLIQSATTASYTPPSTTIGTTYYYAIVTGTCGIQNSVANGITVIDKYCSEPAVLDANAGSSLNTSVGISALNRTGVASTWPGIRKSGWMVLEAKTKGFVLNRVKFNASSQPVADDGTTLVITNPIEGMMVFDTTNNCLKVYTTTNGTNFAWYCMETQTCPE